jgi:DNA-binding NarL/FixJ family response regulator
MREREVLERIACGEAVKQIAYSMGISQHTVITYKRNLYMKTGARSLQQLAIYAVLHSMLP